MSTNPIYLHLSTQTAPKTSQNAQGGIVYALLKDEASTEVFFTLLENQGGSGGFGREIIPLANIAACLNGIDLKQAIPAKRFLKTFAGSKSVNNGGFLVACLRHQGLLKPAPDAHHQHVLGEDHEAWKVRMLETTSDKVFILPVTEKTVSPVPTSPAVRTKKDKKAGDKGKKGASVAVSPEEGGHDHPA